MIRRRPRSTLAAFIQISAATDSAPDDHLAASPHCCVLNSASGHVGEAGRCPTIGAGIISAASVKKSAAARASAPDNHFAAGPDCCVNGSGTGRVGDTGSCPTVGGRIIFAAGV